MEKKSEGNPVAAENKRRVRLLGDSDILWRTAEEDRDGCGLLRHSRRRKKEIKKAIKFHLSLFKKAM
jgi:hypothetical protein